MNNKANAFKSKRFEIEKSVHQRLSHVNIAELIDTGEYITDNENFSFLIIEKGYYNFWIAIFSSHSPKLANLRKHIDWIKSIARQMLDAISHMHDNKIIHRDIKPANFVFKDNTFKSIMMIDFGLAKILDESDPLVLYFSDVTTLEESVGPKHLFSPELIKYAFDKSTPVDHRSDLWQFSRVLWFLITGNISSGRPSKKEDPSGGKFARVVDYMLHDDPSDRIQTIEELKEHIMAI